MKDTDLDELQARLFTFAVRRKPVETGPLALERVNRSLVLRPANPRPELNWLALQCFNAFEFFAVRSSEADGEHPHLSSYQRLLLKSFGQQNVMSEYRFSIALTGPLDPAQLDAVSKALEPVIADVCAKDVCVDGLSLVGEAGGEEQSAPLRLIGRYSLEG